MATLVWIRDGNDWTAEQHGRHYRIAGWTSAFQVTVAADGDNRTLALCDSIERGKQLCEADYVKHADDLPTR